MEKFFKFFSAAVFVFVLVGFVGLGIYLFLEEGPKTAVAVQGQGDPAPDAPVTVVDDPLKESPKKEPTLEEYAYKKAESEVSLLMILFYLLGAVLGLYLLKKLLQLWRYVVKHSV